MSLCFSSNFNLGLDCDTNFMMVSPYGDAGNAGKYNYDDDIIGENFW